MTSLKERRNQLGFSLRDVESITGGIVSNARLSQLENGKGGTTSIQVAMALAAALCVPLETVASWIADPPKIEPPLRCETCGQRLLEGAGHE